MSANETRLYLFTPGLAVGEAFAPALREACAGGGPAAVLLRLEPAEERALVNRVKELAPIAQEAGAAVLVAHDPAFDAATVAVRGGADGVHVGSGELATLRDLRRRLGPERILGAGGLASRDDAMAAGEIPCDYVLFGEPRPSGGVPSIESVIERAGWWSAIFTVPCVVYAPSLASVPRIAATGAEFVALGDAVWGDPDGPGAAAARGREALCAPAEAR